MDYIKANKGDHFRNVVTDSAGNICPQHLVENNPIAKQYAAYSAIASDLEHSVELISLTQNMEPSSTQYSLWMSAIVTYGKCFVTTQGRKIKLEELHVKKFNESAVHFHKEIMELRHNYFAHAGINTNETEFVFLVLSPEQLGKKVIDVSYTVFKQNCFEAKETKLFIALCRGLIQVAYELVDKSQDKLMEVYNSKDLDTIYEHTRKK